MENKDLKSIIEEVLKEMNLGTGSAAVTGEPQKETCAAKAPAAAAAGEGLCIPSKGVKLEPSVVEDGELPDITKIDIRTQYLVDNPVNGEAYAEQKKAAPCRLGIGKAGARYKTLPQLEFRAAHSAAQDAVFNDVDEDFVKSQGLFIVQTQCDSKDTYLTRPDLGRKLSPEVAANTADLLPAIMQGLQSYHIDVGTPFFVKYGRVAVEDEICELTGADVVCTLIGERPGLITATSMSAYIAYKATVGMPEARRTVVSNIHSAGTNPAEAGAHIAEIIKIMLEKKASGTDLKL